MKTNEGPEINIIKEEPELDLYSPNSDWKGRNLNNDHEIVNYPDGTSVRIWFNEQNHGFASHWHTALEIILPVENYYDVEVYNNTYHIMPGEIFIIPSGEAHQLIAPDTGKRFIFLFDISLLARLKGFTSIQPLLAVPLQITRSTHSAIYDDLYRYLIQIRNEYFGTSDYKELTIFSLLITFIVSLGRNHINENAMFPNVRIYKQKEYIQKFNDVLDYIDSHYMEDLSLDDVASSIGFSKYHFTRIFKQYTNSTFYSYLSYRRIKIAEGLLAEVDLSITEIALQSGFSSISTFNRIFKQQKGCTPTEYRTMYSKVHY